VTRGVSGLTLGTLSVADHATLSARGMSRRIIGANPSTGGTSVDTGYATSATLGTCVANVYAMESTCGTPHRARYATVRALYANRATEYATGRTLYATRHDGDANGERGYATRRGECAKRQAAGYFFFVLNALRAPSMASDTSFVTASPRAH
jgi:hypothetical protein